MLSFFIFGAYSIFQHTFWPKLFLTGTTLSILFALYNGWINWISQTTILTFFKEVFSTLIKVLSIILLGMLLSWFLAQWWSIIAIVIFLFILFLIY